MRDLVFGLCGGLILGVNPVIAGISAWTNSCDAGDAARYCCDGDDGRFERTPGSALSFEDLQLPVAELRMEKIESSLR